VFLPSNSKVAERQVSPRLFDQSLRDLFDPVWAGDAREREVPPYLPVDGRLNEPGVDIVLLFPRLELLCSNERELSVGSARIFPLEVEHGGPDEGDGPQHGDVARHGGQLVLEYADQEEGGAEEEEGLLRQQGLVVLDDEHALQHGQAQQQRLAHEEVVEQHLDQRQEQHRAQPVREREPVAQADDSPQEGALYEVRVEDEGGDNGRYDGEKIEGRGGKRRIQI